MTEILGIHQSDILIRSAVIWALKRMRDNPKLIDSVFRSLAEDDLTKLDYGDQEIARAKEWFLKTDIPVFMSYRVDEPKFPCISISLQESSETENTLGDVHYVTSEDTEGDWPAISGPFTPTAYSPSSGMMVIPADPIAGLTLAPGMYVIDRDGRAHLVNEVLDDDTIAVTAGTVADFTGAILKGAKPRLVTSIESANCRETYQIGCHVQGESFYLSWLHSILLFTLFRYRQDLLERRGFERSSVTSSEFRRNSEFDQELVFSRGITINGFVRQVWPKDEFERIDVADTTLVVRTTDTPEALVPADDTFLGVEVDGEVVPV